MNKKKYYIKDKDGYHELAPIGTIEADSVEVVVDEYELLKQAQEKLGINAEA